jgi:hypothetical protein
MENKHLPRFGKAISSSKSFRPPMEKLVAEFGCLCKAFLV